MPRATQPLTRLRRAVPKATRHALEQTFRLWLEHYAPEHFERGAFGRYRPYGTSRKHDKQEWLRRHPVEARRGAEVRPLKRSGRFRNAFLGGGYRFSGSYRRLSVRWSNLPSYVTRPNRHSEFTPAQAVVAWTDAEADRLRQAFGEWLRHYLLDEAALAQYTRSHGRVVFNP